MLVTTLLTSTLLFASVATPATPGAGNGTLMELRQQIDVPAAGWTRAEHARELLRVTTVQRITYLSDGLAVRGYLAKPRTPGRYPAIIMNRGGNREFGAFTDETAVYQLAKVASWGYVVVASQYRGNAGGEGREEFGGADVNDVLNLIPLLEQMPEVDAKRLGVYGWSRGGMMTFLALTRTDRFRAAAVGGALADPVENIRRRPEMESVYSELVPNFAETRDAQLAARTALRWPDKLHKNTPILLLHGTADWRVEPEQSLALAAALLKAKHPFRLVIFEGGDHGLSEHRAEVDEAVREWLDRYVRDAQKWPSLEPHGR